jgi:tetratricopeptide (TPR) repeat protein
MGQMVSLWLICVILSWSPEGLADSPTLRHARTLIAHGKLDEAARVLRDVLEGDPASFDARVLLGTTLAIQGTRRESIQQITEAVKLRPLSAEAYNLLGTTLSRFMETADAKTAFERAVVLDPGLAEAHVNLALLMAQSGDWDGAGGHLDRALALQGKTPASAYSHYLRAKTYIARSRVEKADAELEEAVKIKPNLAEAWSDLGWVRRMLSDDTGAMHAFERSVLLNPEDPVSQYRLGTACLRSGEATRAIAHLRAAIKWGGADKPTLYNLEQALRKTGNVNEAQEVHKQMENQLRASRVSSENALLISTLNTEGMQLEKEGDFHGATAKYRMALDLDPAAGGIRLNYGLSLCRERQWKDGIAEIEEVLRQDPNDGAAAKALYIAKEQADANSKPVK